MLICEYVGGYKAAPSSPCIQDRVGQLTWAFAQPRTHLWFSSVTPAPLGQPHPHLPLPSVTSLCALD